MMGIVQRHRREPDNELKRKGGDRKRNTSQCLWWAHQQTTQLSKGSLHFWNYQQKLPKLKREQRPKSNQKLRLSKGCGRITWRVCVLVGAAQEGILELFKETEEIFETMMMENFPQINVRHETTGPQAQGTSRKNAPKPLYPGRSFSKEGNTEETVTTEADVHLAASVITLNITG